MVRLPSGTVGEVLAAVGVVVEGPTEQLTKMGVRPQVLQRYGVQPGTEVGPDPMPVSLTPGVTVTVAMVVAVVVVS